MTLINNNLRMTPLDPELSRQGRVALYSKELECDFELPSDPLLVPNLANWSIAPGFTHADGKSCPAEATTVWFGHTAKAFYAIFKAEVENNRPLAMAPAPSGPLIYHGEAVQIYIDIEHNMASYCEFLITPDPLFGPRQFDRTWFTAKYSGEWEHKVCRTDEFWTAAVKIPWSKFKFIPEAGSIIGINFSRTHYELFGCDWEWSTLAATHGLLITPQHFHVHRPQFFADLQLGGERVAADPTPEPQTAPEVFTGLRVAVLEPTTKLCRASEVPEQATPVLRFAAAKRDREGAVIAIAAGGETLNVSAEFRHTPELKTSIRRIGMVEVYGLGEWPDPLLPGNSCVIEPEEFAQFFVTVEALAAGTFSGELVLRLNEREMLIPLEFEAWAFELPRSIGLKSFFYSTRRCLDNWYGAPLTQEKYRKWLEAALDARITPMLLEDGFDWQVKIHKNQDGTWGFDFTLLDDELAFCRERGMRLFSVGPNNSSLASMKIAYYTDSDGVRQTCKLEHDEYLKFVEAYFRAAYRHFSISGEADNAYCKAMDEPDPDNNEQQAALAEFAGAVLRGWPGLKLMVTQSPRHFPESRQSVLVWVPLLHEFRADDAAEQHQLGGELWHYTCNLPQSPPYPSLEIGLPGIYHRILPWATAAVGADGLLCWSLNIFSSWYDPGMRRYMPPDKKWPAAPWNDWIGNGEGYLLYPGPDGEPWSSLRLECLREGAEDYEYFLLLKQLNPEHLLLKLNDIIPNCHEFPLDPKILTRRRRQIANAILKELQK